MENKDSMVLYGSVYRQFERLLQRGKKEEALEYIQAVMEYGFDGVIPNEDSDVWLYGFDSNMISIDNAAARYAKAQESGSRGGRPKISLDKDEVMKKKEELRTWGAVAKYYGISERTLYNFRHQSTPDKSENRKKPESENSENFPEKFRNGKNLNVNVNVTENANVTETLTETRKEQLMEEVSIDGFIRARGCFVSDNIDQAARELSGFGYSQTEIDFLLAQLFPAQHSTRSH